MFTNRAIPYLLILSAMLCLTACGRSKPPRVESLPTDGTAEPPFSAAQIRAATREGRTYVFEQFTPSQRTFLRRVRFSEVNDVDCVMESVELAPDRSPRGEARVVRAKWTDLEAHARWPKAHTVVEDIRCQTPLGEGACKRYTVTVPEDNNRIVATFALDFPGAPVNFELTQAKRLMLRMKLVEYEPGGQAE